MAMWRASADTRGLRHASVRPNHLAASSRQHASGTCRREGGRDGGKDGGNAILEFCVSSLRRMFFTTGRTSCLSLRIGTKNGVSPGVGRSSRRRRLQAGLLVWPRPPWMARGKGGPPCGKGKVGALPPYRGKGGCLTAGKVGARWERWVPCHLAAGKVGALPLFRDDSARGRRSVCGHEAT